MTVAAGVFLAPKWVRLVILAFNGNDILIFVHFGPFFLRATGRYYSFHPNKYRFRADFASIFSDQGSGFSIS